MGARLHGHTHDSTSAAEFAYLSLFTSVCVSGGVSVWCVRVCLSVILYKLQSSLETLHSLAGICSPAAFNRVQTWHARQ